MLRHDPALVYTVNASAGTMADIRDYLLCRGLFTYEHHDEVVADCAQPALARPQLARLIANARMATAAPDIEPSAGYGAVRVVVTDSLENLGQTPLERAGVVGVLEQLGLQVHADYQRLNGAWYHAQVSRYGFAAIDSFISALLDKDFFLTTIVEWMEEVGIDDWVPSDSGRHGSASQRIHDLALAGLKPHGDCPAVDR